MTSSARTPTYRDFNRSAVRVWIVIAALMAVPTASSAPALGGGVDGPQVIVVDQSHPLADDANPGTATRPTRTITRAIELASVHNAGSIPVRVLIRSGVYRESVQLTADDTTTSAPITIEGEGDVVISGSDPWTDWIAEGDGVFSHPWPHNWGVAADPSWPGHVLDYLRDHPIISRREMVFADGTPLLQVLSADEMGATEDSFFVSEDDDLLTIHLNAARDVATSEIEVAVRSSLLLVGSRENVVIEGLTFEHAANGLDERAAVAIADSSNVTIARSRFVLNNGSALGFFRDVGVSVRDVHATHNGISGLTGFRVQDLVVADTEASFNGWRGARGWDPADHTRPVDVNFIDFGTGQKFFGLRRATFRNYRAIGNQTGGLWLDYDNSDVHVEGAELLNNLTHGLMVEASQGPVSIESSRICGNETGILVNSSSNGRVVDNVIAGNILGQFVVFGGARSVLAHDTGEELSIQTESWVVQRNKIATDSSQLAVSNYLDLTSWSAYVATLTANDNRYSSPSSRRVFQLPGAQTVSLRQWRSETGVDKRSSFKRAPFDCLVAELPIESRPGLSYWVVAAAAGAIVVAALGFFLGLRRFRRFGGWRS
jgi:hypothetical protein